MVAFEGVDVTDVREARVPPVKRRQALRTSKATDESVKRLIGELTYLLGRVPTQDEAIAWSTRLALANVGAVALYAREGQP